MDLCNPAVIKEVMNDAGITFQKKFGQNFLINKSVPERIAKMCADDPDSLILEIGPGIGCLTRELALRYGEVAAVEIDTGLLPILERTLAGLPNVSVKNADVMELDLPRFLSERAGGRSVSVAANLPYYITTPILMKLLESGFRFKSITVMVQAEVAARLCAKAGSADYGAITAVLGYYGSVRRLFTVPAGCFLPAPKVDSAVVRIDLYESVPFALKDTALYFGLIRAAFGQRRKTLQNAVNAAYPHLSKQKIADALVAIGQPATVRGERLSSADFADLANQLV
ncbi:MAG: 16S rRNA (adenine(1518)-N(6)/adenine(1519)-N(6))-dimethyltransferase RsmA [Clostridia bacterium]|nr:16S rRNA (adenine(1518)-N(6)/adenine(1519)-N(6))-dimethyltransferase RsmA [Clostridia bacterium]